MPARKRARRAADGWGACPGPSFTPWRWTPAAASGPLDDSAYAELYVEHHERGARYAWCRLCCSSFAQQPCGLANFKRHLGKVHPMFLLKRDEDMRSYGADVHAPSATPTVNTLFNYTAGGVGVAELARSLAVFCAQGCFALSGVDGPAMQGLLRSVLKRPSGAAATLPSRYQVARALVQLNSEHDEAMSRRMASAVAGRAAFPGQLAVTMDAWTSRGARGYLGATVAYIDDAWTLQSSVIACAPLGPPHSGELVAEAFREHLPAPAKLQHVCAVVTDNGANFVLAAKQLASDRSMRCAAHTIQLVLNDAAKMDPMQRIVGCVTRLHARFAKSQSRREALANAAARAGVAPLMPIGPATTRWDSNYFVLRRFCQIYPALVRMSPEELGFAGPAEYGEAWAAVAACAPLVEPLCGVLAPFAQWTRALQSATKATLSRVPACVDELLRATRADEDAPGDIRTIKEQLHAAVRARLQPLAETTLVRVARLLDPGQFRGYFRRDATGRLDQAFADELANDMRATMHLASRTIERQYGDAGADDSGEVDDGLAEEVRAWNGWPADDLLRALKAYSSTDKSQAADPLDWWRQYGARLAPLDMVARWVLCIPATSAESERTFSLSGRIVSPLRTRLAGDRVHDLTLLASELRRRATLVAAARGTEDDDEGGPPHDEAQSDGDEEGEAMDKAVEAPHEGGALDRSGADTP
jgi:hypothetical protein